MKLSKKIVLLATTAIAAFGFTCAANAFEQKDSSDYSVKLSVWSEDEINHPDRIDYQYCTDKSFDDAKTRTFENETVGDEFIIGPDLKAGKSYWFRWRVAGGSTYSEAYEFVTTPRFGDDAKATQTAATANSATFTWTKASGATGYRILNNDGNVVKTVTTNSATLNLSAEASYRVEPIRKASTTPFIATKEANSVYANLKVAPTVPKNQGSYSQWYTWGYFFHFTWEKVTGADGYEIEYALYNGKNKVVKETEYDDYSVADPKNTFYRFRVRAFVKCGEKKFYSNWSGYKYAAQDTASVVKLKVTSGKKKKIRISWMRIKGAKKYIVYMAKNNDGGYKKVKTTKKRTLVLKKFKKKKLQRGAEYYFKVIAVGKFEKKTVKSENRTYSYIKVE